MTAQDFNVEGKQLPGGWDNFYAVGIAHSVEFGWAYTPGPWGGSPAPRLGPHTCATALPLASVKTAPTRSSCRKPSGMPTSERPTIYAHLTTTKRRQELARLLDTPPAGTVNHENG